MQINPAQNIFSPGQYKTKPVVSKQEHSFELAENRQVSCGNYIANLVPFLGKNRSTVTADANNTQEQYRQKQEVLAESFDKLQESCLDDSLQLNRNDMRVNGDSISAEKEKELFKAYHAGSEEAFVKLIQSNYKYIVALSARYIDLGVERADLISAGKIGLIKAIGKFDPDRNERLYTFATRAICGEMLKQVWNSKPVHYPEQIHVKAVAYLHARKRLAQELGRSPSLEEVADAENYSKKDVNELSDYFNYAVSLDAPIKAKESKSEPRLRPTLMSTMSRSKMTEESIFEMDKVKKIFSALTELERDSILLPYFYGMSQEEIAKMFGVNWRSVDNGRQRAKRKLAMAIQEYDGINI